MKGTGFLYREKDGTEVKGTSRVKIRRATGYSWISLKIKETMVGDAGTYKLTAKNVEGTDYSEAKVFIKGNFPKGVRAKHHFVS